MWHIGMLFPSLDDLIDRSLLRQALDPKYKKKLEEKIKCEQVHLEKMQVMCDKCGKIASRSETKKYYDGDTEDENSKVWTGLIIHKKECL